MSLLLQSKMQDDGVLEKFDDWTLEEVSGFSDAYRNAKFAEGHLLDAHVQKYGELPAWNGNRGSREGHGSPSPLRGSKAEEEMMRAITGIKPESQHGLLDDLAAEALSPFLARYTIRELPGIFRHQATEDTMHGIRMHMLSNRTSYDEAAAFLKSRSQGEVVDLLETERYLERIPTIFS